MMGFATSAMSNFHGNARQSPRPSRRALILMVVPFAANISYADFSVRPLTHVRGSTHRSDPVPTKNSIFVTRSVTERRLVLGPSLPAASSVGTSHFPTARRVTFGKMLLAISIFFVAGFSTENLNACRTEVRANVLMSSVIWFRSSFSSCRSSSFFWSGLAVRSPGSGLCYSAVARVAFLFAILSPLNRTQHTIC